MASSKDNIARLGEDDKLLAGFVTEIEKSEDELSPWKNNLLVYYELYNMIQRNKNYDGIAKIFVPETLRAVETVVGKLMEILFASSPWFEYSGRDEYDQEPARAMTQLVRYQTDENDFETRVADSLRQMCIAGFTVRKLGWEFAEALRQKPQKTDAGIKPLPDVSTVKDVWQLDPVDLFGFHVSDIRTIYNDIQKARWIAEQKVVDRQWIRERVKTGWLTDSAQEKWTKDADSQSLSSKATNYREQRDSANGFRITKRGGEFEVIERWGLIEAHYVYTAEELATKQLESDDMVESVAVIVNRKGFAKLEANPYYHQMKPYVSCPYIPKEGQLTGMGIVQIGEKLQEELNDTRNQVMDNKTLNLMTMWLKSRTSGIKNADLRIRPNGVIQTNDMKGLEPLRPPILSGNGINIEGVIKEDLRQSVGASSNLQGIAQAGVDTATESSLINRESLGRILLVANTYGKLVLKKALIMAEWLNYQFYDHIQVIRIIGADGVKYKKLSPEEIMSGHKDVIIHIAADYSDNPAVKKQQSMAFFGLLQAMLPEQIAFHWKMLDKMYRQHYGGRSLAECYDAPIDKADLLSPEEEVDLILADQPVLAKPGQDHQSCLAYLIPEYSSMRFSISDLQNKNFQKLIMSHQTALQAEMEQQAAQFMMSMEQQTTGAGAKGPGSLNKGQSPNMAASTLSGGPATPSTGSMRQELGN